MLTNMGLLYTLSKDNKTLSTKKGNYKIFTRDDLKYLLSHSVNESDIPDNLWEYRAVLLDENGKKVILSDLNEIIINKEKRFNSDTIPTIV